MVPCAAPIMNGAFMGYTQWWSGGSDNLLARWRAKMDRDFVPLMQRSLALWGPLHIINFLYVPQHFRVVYLSTGLVLWMAYLSWTAHKRVLQEQQEALADRNKQ